MTPHPRFLWLAAALLLGASALHAQTTIAAAAPWYRRARALDLTGTDPSDSVVLTATGKRADSLAVSMSFYVGGAVVHRQRWTSADELADMDSLRKAPAKLAAFMRLRLDQSLASVKRERMNRAQVAEMGDEALLRKIVPRPTHQIALSFGYENSLYFVWNPARRTLVVFMECC